MFKPLVVFSVLIFTFGCSGSSVKVSQHNAHLPTGTEADAVNELNAMFESAHAQRSADVVQLRGAVQSRQTEMLGVLRQFPEAKELSLLLHKISSLAEKRGLETQELRPLPEEWGTYHAEIRVETELLGSFSEFSQLVGDLSQTTRIVSVDELVVTPLDSKKGSGEVRIKAEWVTYRLLSDSEKMGANADIEGTDERPVNEPRDPSSTALDLEAKAASIWRSQMGELEMSEDYLSVQKSQVLGLQSLSLQLESLEAMNARLGEFTKTLGAFSVRRDFVSGLIGVLGAVEADFKEVLELNVSTDSEAFTVDVLAQEMTWIDSLIYDFTERGIPVDVRTQKGQSQDENVPSEVTNAIFEGVMPLGR